jgi:cobalt-zinc-cadmium efflux system outer membrane protein
LPQVAANLDAHPALAHDEQLIAAAAAHVKSEERQRLPVVDALLTVTAGDPSLGYAPDVIGGLAFELPVLNQRGGPVDKARADEAIAREQAAADRLRFDAALREAHVRATAASERVVAFERDVLPAAVKARAMTQEGYQDGRVDLLRLLEAQRAVLEARLSSLDARVAYQRAMVELERTSGVELIPKETP